MEVTPDTTEKVSQKLKTCANQPHRVTAAEQEVTISPTIVVQVVGHRGIDALSRICRELDDSLV